MGRRLARFLGDHLQRGRAEQRTECPTPDQDRVAAPATPWGSSYC